MDEVSWAETTHQQQLERGEGGGGRKWDREQEEEGGGARGGDQMKIAWRYQNLPKVQVYAISLFTTLSGKSDQNI